MALQSVFQEKCLLIFKLLVFAISIVMAPIHIGAECSRGVAAINVVPFSGEVVHTYIGFIAANGKDMSNSFIPVSWPFDRVSDDALIMLSRLQDVAAFFSQNEFADINATALALLTKLTGYVAR